MAADPKPLKLWDRDKGKAVEEFMPDHQTTYETRPLFQQMHSQAIHTRDETRADARGKNGSVQRR